LSQNFIKTRFTCANKSSLLAYNPYLPTTDLPIYQPNVQIYRFPSPAFFDRLRPGNFAIIIGAGA
jgi:hypothetical protein